MKYLLIFLSSFIIFAANAAPEPKDVNVVRMPDISGTVNANLVGEPTVNAQQSGDWNVNINSMPSVTIDNLDPIPVIQSRPERTPYVGGTSGSFVDGVYVYDFQPSSDKLFVVETISYRTSVVNTENLIIVFIRITTGGVAHDHSLTIPPCRNTSSNELCSATLPVRFYVDPGTPVFTRADTFGPGTGEVGSGIFSLSGYLIDPEDTSLAP